MTDSARLESLLVDHPSADDDVLVFTLASETTKREAVALARRVADDARGAGLGPGEPVAVQMPNGPEMVAAMFGVWIAGGVFVPVNARAPETEVAHVVDATRPRLLVREIGRPEPAAGHVAVHDSGIALVLFTSGTTGRPKAVLHGHGEYLAILDRVLGGIGAAPKARTMPNLIPVSLALNAGIYNVLFAFRSGAPIAIMDRFATGDFAEMVRRFSIRSTVLPPAAMVMLADDDALDSLEPLTFVRSITAPLPPDQARRFRERFGVFVLNSYGQAEMGEVIGWSAADAREHPDKIGAAGRPHPGVDIRVDTDGELWIRPAAMTRGYAAGGDLADRLDADGYLRTGDLARVDADGFVWIEGRVSDLINRGGNKVVPGEVEDVLRAVPGVADAAVVGVADERLGQVPVAFVVPADAADPPQPAALEAACRAVLTPYKVPVRFETIDALPRNEIGKVLRADLAVRPSGR
jgi:long-chain acyl-CoA synthetase